MKLKKGFLIVFEGIDGAGKTTQARLLSQHLRDGKYDVILSKEPTDSIYGKEIRGLAQTKRLSTSALHEYRLFVNDRKLHVGSVIKPALRENKIVILDRYYFSTMAYQGARGLDPTMIRAENELFSPSPDIVFLIDVPPLVGISRIKKSRKENPNLFEREKSLKSVSKIFNSLKDSYIVRLNGVQDPIIIHKKVINITNDVSRGIG